MRIGKLSVRSEDHPKLGKIFVLEVSNDESCEIWESEGDRVKLRISQNTALLLAEFIDIEVEEQLPSGSGDNEDV